MYAENWPGHKIMTYGAKKMVLQLRVHTIPLLQKRELNSIPSTHGGVHQGVSTAWNSNSWGYSAFVKCRHLHSGTQTYTHTHTQLKLTKHLKEINRAEEMDHWLSMHTPLEEDPSIIPSFNNKGLTTACNSCSRRSNSLSGLSRHKIFFFF